MNANAITMGLSIQDFKLSEIVTLQRSFDNLKTIKLIYIYFDSRLIVFCFVVFFPLIPASYMWLFSGSSSLYDSKL